MEFSALICVVILVRMWPQHAWVQAGQSHRGQPGLSAAGARAGHLDPAALAAAGTLGAGATHLRNKLSGVAETQASLQIAPLLLSLCGLGAVVQAAQRRRRVQCRATSGTELPAASQPVSRHQALRGAIAAVSAASMALPASAEEQDATWVQYDLNTGETLYDIDFDAQDPNHGFVVGARGLFYETKDGGKRWVSRSFANLSKGEDISYRFQTVSTLGSEVWIVGKPPLLLHSKDAGATWKKVPVSRKLPGEPKVILATGPGKAEMATSSGAVYVTDNDGKNWKSIVKETVDATLNRVSSSGVQGASYFTGSVKSIKRASDGEYVAIAQRGNFYLTFKPGEPRWIPHNRISARRIQAMGFREAGNGSPSEGVWMSLNGGYLTESTDPKYAALGVETKDLFSFSAIRTGGIGIIDAAFRTSEEGWAVGGSGVIYLTKDGGKTWQFDPSGAELPCNLYTVKFFNGGKVGYMIGSAGILLRKTFAA